MKNCKNCGKACISIYCSKNCKREYSHKINYDQLICPTCHKEFERMKSKQATYCSKKCALSNKELTFKRISNTHKTCIEKYGVSNYSQTEECKKKIKVTNIQRYGVESNLMLESCKEKIKQTNLIRYGVEYPSQSDEIKLKSLNTVNRKFNGFPFEISSSLHNSCQTTIREIYGVDNVSQSEEIQEAVKLTNLKKFNCETFVGSDIGKAVIKQALLDKYGVATVGEIPNIHDNTIRTRMDNFYDDFIVEKVRLYKCEATFGKSEYTGCGKDKLYKFKCLTCNKIFDDYMYNNHITKCSICHPSYTRISKFQRLVYNHVLKTYPDALLEIYLPAINKYADILIPSINKIIECHGDYWHCNPEMYKSDYYHKRIHLTAQEIWNNDSLRIKILESAGYVVEVVWEDKVDNYINNTQL